MITSIKNNLSLLPKRDRLRYRLGGYNLNKKTEYNLPKATTKQIKAIAKRTKEEHNIRMAKVIVVTIIIFFLLSIVFYNLQDGILKLLSFK